MTPASPVRIVTIRDTPVRLYAHPSVEHGRPWCALADIAGLVGYPPEMCRQVTDRWRRAYPDLAVVAHDRAVIVSDAVVCGFLEWLGAEGLEAAGAIWDAYDHKTGQAYLLMTASVPYAVWREAAQRSTLADALPDPTCRVN